MEGVNSGGFWVFGGDLGLGGAVWCWGGLVWVWGGFSDGVVWDLGC